VKLMFTMSAFQNECLRLQDLRNACCSKKRQENTLQILRVPGAGIRPYSGDSRTAALGFITLEIGIHGIPVNLDLQVYMDLNGGALAGYPSIRMNDRTHIITKGFTWDASGLWISFLLFLNLTVKI